MTALSLIDIAAKRRISAIVSRHLTIVALTTFVLHAYRDLWPLATYTLKPEDGSGPVLWVKIALLAFIGVIEPLNEPKAYIPATLEVGPLHSEHHSVTLAWH